MLPGRDRKSRETTLRRIPVTPRPLARVRVEPPYHGLVVDDQTFRDLEVFEAQGGPSLFDMLNRCRTAGGADALKLRFRRPFSKVEPIRAVHESLRHIMANRRGFDHLPESAMLTALENYLHSNRAVLTSTKGLDQLIEALSFRYGDRKIFRETLAGVHRAAAAIRMMARFAARPELQDAPGELAERLAEMRELVEHPVLAHIASSDDNALSWFQLLHYDRQLRREERPALERLMKLCFELDALVSMADATEELGYVLPEVHEGDAEASGDDVAHPFLAHPVANPLQVGQPRRLLFVTGPNMAGKTTYLKACGTAVYLAHLGMGVPASRFRFSPCDTLFSAITLADNVREGVSFFRAEALRVKRIAQALADGRRVFALLDEPFKGTNVKDAVDASRAVFEHFADAEQSIFLVSSHLTEVAESLEPNPAVTCARFEADESGGALQYDFVLRPGISTQRLGVRVLRDEGVFELLGKISRRATSAPPAASETGDSPVPPGSGSFGASRPSGASEASGGSASGATSP